MKIVIVILWIINACCGLYVVHSQKAAATPGGISNTKWTLAIYRAGLFAMIPAVYASILGNICYGSILGNKHMLIEDIFAISVPQKMGDYHIATQLGMLLIMGFITSKAYAQYNLLCNTNKQSRCSGKKPLKVETIQSVVRGYWIMLAICAVALAVSVNISIVHIGMAVVLCIIMAMSIWYMLHLVWKPGSAFMRRCIVITYCVGLTCVPYLCCPYSDVFILSLAMATDTVLFIDLEYPIDMANDISVQPI